MMMMMMMMMMGSSNLYSGMVSCLDEAVAYVKKAMQQAGMWEDTVTIFTTGKGPHGGWDKMAAILQATFSNAFYSNKMFVFLFQFHWSLFLITQLTVNQHWFRQWLVTCSAPSHYLNQLMLTQFPDAYMRHLGKIDKHGQKVIAIVA